MGPRVLRALLFALASLGLLALWRRRRATVPRPEELPAGLDLMETAPEGAEFRFDRISIPGGFFSSRSEPFTGRVRFRGRPLPERRFATREVFHVDTVVERKQPARLEGRDPCSAEVPIEVVGLALESMEPLEVHAGGRTELWDAAVELSSARPSEGAMTITRSHRRGGTFDSEMLIFPRFRFLRRADGAERVLDMGELPLPDDVLEGMRLRSTASPWRRQDPSALQIRGVNDGFIAGAPARINEDADACGHPVSEAPSCNVIIIAESRCLCLGKTRPFTGRGSPAGGSYRWSITRGSRRARITGGGRSRHVTVEGRATSRLAGDIRLQVEYSAPEGGTCTASIELTTIDAELRLRAGSGQTLSQLNDVRGAPQLDPSFPRLGPVRPGNPAGTRGYLKNVEVEVRIEPGDLRIPCAGELAIERTIREGRSGAISPGGNWDPDPIDCPVGPCPDDSQPWAQDLTPAPAQVAFSTIYDVDAPGIPTGGSSTCGNDGEVRLNWAHFEQILTVAGQRCGNTLRWHANTRIRCDGGQWTELDAAVGLGHPDPGYDVPARRIGPRFELRTAIERLTAEDPETRLESLGAIEEALAAGRLSREQRDRAAAELLQIAAGDTGHREPASPLRAALRLLAELRVEDAAPLFLEHLLEDFGRPVAKGPPTPAAWGLVRLGGVAIQPVVEYSGRASEEEWQVLESVLWRIGDQDRVARAVGAALDQDPGELADARLGRWFQAREAALPPRRVSVG